MEQLLPLQIVYEASRYDGWGDHATDENRFLYEVYKGRSYPQFTVIWDSDVDVTLRHESKAEKDLPQEHLLQQNSYSIEKVFHNDDVLGF